MFLINVLHLQIFFICLFWMSFLGPRKTEIFSIDLENHVHNDPNGLIIKCEIGGHENKQRKLDVRKSFAARI